MDSNKTRIGKDVIESLTLAMYDDPRFIYREYIQNSADQIDIAFDEKLISTKEEGVIEIKIDKTLQSITISDNGTGVPKDKVLSILKNIAQGVKDRTKHKGFRGIGRLGGLAYCDKLTFETSYSGEPTKSILTWDAKKLKEIINDRSKKEDASEVIDIITSLKTEQEKPEERYFRVILDNVSNDILLNKKDIIDYLSMVAPVPYKSGFYYDEKIYKKANELGCSIDEYNIYVNNNQIFKEYTTTIYDLEKSSKKRIDEIFNIDFLEIRNSKNELLCWGWYCLSKLKQQMPEVNIARGIRLRKGNIQIGDENRLANLFVSSNVQDKRFSFYFFGEIHAISPDLIPNARRDYFTENKTFETFEKETKIVFKKLKEYCYFSSNVRSEERKIQKFIDFTEEYKTKNQNGFTKPEDKKKLDEKFDELKENAEKAKQKIEKIGQNVEDDTKVKIFEKITKESENLTQKVENKNKNNNSKPKLISDELSKHNRNERKLVSKILGIIDNILPKELSENVKQKIVEELNK